jgi:hypothetical protein
MTDLNKEIRLKLANKIQRTSELMGECCYGYKNKEHESYRWNSLKRLKYMYMAQFEPYESERLKEYYNSDTHKRLMATKGKNGFEILINN